MCVRINICSIKVVCFSSYSQKPNYLKWPTFSSKTLRFALHIQNAFTVEHSQVEKYDTCRIFYRFAIFSSRSQLNVAMLVLHFLQQQKTSPSKEKAICVKLKLCAPSSIRCMLLKTANIFRFIFVISVSFYSFRCVVKPMFTFTTFKCYSQLRLLRSLQTANDST